MGNASNAGAQTMTRVSLFFCGHEGMTAPLPPPTYKYPEAHLALVHCPGAATPEERRIMSALTWPQQQALMPLGMGVHVNLVVTAVDPASPMVSDLFMTARLRYAIYQRLQEVATPDDHVLLDREFERGVNGRGSKWVEVSEALWLTIVGSGRIGGGGGGGDSTEGNPLLPPPSPMKMTLKLHVRHHLAYFALIREVRRPNTKGLKCRNQHFYHVHLQEADPTEQAMLCKEKGTFDAIVLERMWCEQILHQQALGQHHVLACAPPRDTMETQSDKAWTIVVTPKDAANPLEQGKATCMEWLQALLLQGTFIQQWSLEMGRAQPGLVAAAQKKVPNAHVHRDMLWCSDGMVMCTSDIVPFMLPPVVQAPRRECTNRRCMGWCLEHDGDFHQ